MTSITHAETTISAVPDLPIVEIVREFDAPPERVFRAHVDRDLFTQWIGPRDIDMQVEQWDARTGGSYRYVHGRGDEESASTRAHPAVRPVDRGVDRGAGRHARQRHGVRSGSELREARRPARRLTR